MKWLCSFSTGRGFNLTEHLEIKFHHSTWFWLEESSVLQLLCAQPHARAFYIKRVSIWNWKQPWWGSYFKYISPLHSKPHKLWLRRAFVRKTQTGETAYFTCNIKQSAVYHSASCAMKPVNVLEIRFNLSELYERLFYGRFEWCMCVRNCKQAEYGRF